MLLINGKRKEDLPPMKKAARFELVGFSMESNNFVDDNGQKYTRKSKLFKLPTIYTVFDKGKNQNVEYRYAIQEIPVVGKDGTSMKYTPDRIIFEEANLIVNTDKPDLYEFLKRSPWLEGSESLRKLLFKEVDPQAQAQSRLEKEATRNKAMRLVVEDGALPEITLRRILASFGDPGEYDIAIVREKLMEIVEKDPAKFLASIGSRDIEVKSLISDLSKKSVIHYDSAKMQWQWGNATKENGIVILGVPIGRSETDWLTEELFKNSNLLKTFKAIAGRREEPVATTQDRQALILRLKELAKETGDTKAAVGSHLLSTENLIKKVKQLEEKLTTPA